MDVHRARFVPHAPLAAITALAFSRPDDRGYNILPALKLALGRGNGTIEIWNPHNANWVQETMINGDGKSIEGLAWTQDPDDMDNGRASVGQHRLFSIAASPTVTEWDLGKGMVKQTSTGNLSDIWSFAAQPRSTTAASSCQDLVIGCGDGSIALLTTADGDLQFRRYLARISSKKARCMCITYQGTSTVLAGFEDSMVRVYDTRTGSLLRTMSFGVGIPGAPRNILIWKIHCLPNGDIISADSNGEVRIWDGKTYSLLQRIKAHDTDCLDLSVSSDGKMIMSASIDGKVAVFRRTQQTSGRSAWAKTQGRRLHKGEFKAMASFDSSRLSIVISGGSDPSPIVIPLREFGRENPRTLPYLPARSPVTSAPKARLLVSRSDREVFIWRIEQKAGHADTERRHPQKLVGRLKVAVNSTICDVSVSDDGRLLAVGTFTEIKVFQIRPRSTGVTLSIRQITVPSDMRGSGVNCLTFSPDGKWLAAVSLESEIHVARVDSEPTKPTLLRLLERTIELDRCHRPSALDSAYRDYDRRISRIAFSQDSSMLVGSDQSGHLESWILKGHEDMTAPAIDVSISGLGHTGGTSKHESSDDDGDDDDDDDEDEEVIYFGQHWADNPASRLIPKLDSAALVLAFRPVRAQISSAGNPGVHGTRHNPHAHSRVYAGNPGHLWILTARHEMVEFDMLAGTLSQWSRENPTTALPEEFRRILDRAKGAVWDDKQNRQRLWLYGNSWMFMVDVNDKAGLNKLPADKRRKRKPREAESDIAGPKRVRQESGAGGQVAYKARVNFVDDVRRFDGRKTTELPVDVDRGVEGDSADRDLDWDDVGNGILLSTAQDVGNEDDGEQRRMWWATFRYRPILGVVPLDNSENDTLEVVVVERPHSALQPE